MANKPSKSSNSAVVLQKGSIKKLIIFFRLSSSFKMNSISDWNLAIIFRRMRPSSWQKFINLGFGYIFDNYFFNKYFRIHGIPKTPQPDLPQLIGWEMRKLQETDLSKTPWDDESQSPQWITGDDNNGYTIYYDNSDQDAMIEENLLPLVQASMQSGNDHYTATENGYFETFVLKNPNIASQDSIAIIICIRYCPYDALTIGYYLPEFNIWEFDYTSHYYGQSVDGLRWGKGVVKFDNGFELYIDGWPDQQLMKEGKNAAIPPTPINFPELLSRIMQKYLDWGEKTNYFFQNFNQNSNH